MNKLAFEAPLVAVMALAVAGCSPRATEPDLVRPVRAIQAGDLQAIGGRQFAGRASAKTEVDLSFQVSGPLIQLPVDVGSVVAEGQTVAALDPRDFQTAVEGAEASLARAHANLSAMERGARPEEIEQLRAALAQAEARHQQAVAEHDRNERLLPEGAVSQSMYDLTLARRQTTQAAVQQAQEELNIGLRGAREEDLAAKRAEIQGLEATVSNARNQLADATLTAPFGGTIAARYVDNFQPIQAKQPIMRLLNISQIEVTVQVPENLISLVPLVKQALCRFDAIADREFVATVTRVGSEASQLTRTFPVTLQIEQPDDVQILPGMAATVRVETDASRGEDSEDLIIPVSAVFNADAREPSQVWILESQGDDRFIASRRAVTIGRLTPVGVVVTLGLARGEWVVTAGVNSLRERQVVRILEEGSH